MKVQGFARTRWAALGAAVAVSIGGGGLAITHATVSSGERAVFVAIAPCRLFDTRPTTQVGPRNTPLGAGETYAQGVRGANGNCTIPNDAVAVAMNVTAVNGTLGSFLTVWPSDVSPRPNVSSLNWQPGQPATPNKVDVRLSTADGKINLFNPAGTVDVLADVVGYYADHNHDDRYLSKNGSVTIGHAAFVGDNGPVDFQGGCAVAPAGTTTLEASVPLPTGVTVTSFKVSVIDSAGAPDAAVLLRSTTFGVQATLATISAAGASGYTTLTATLATPDTVESGEYYYIRYTPNSTAADICGAEVIYTA